MRHIGLRQTLWLGDKVYHFSRYERRLVRRWLDWARTVLPNPLEQVEKALPDLPEECAVAAVDIARDLTIKSLCLDSPELRELAYSWQGVRHSLALCLEELPLPEAYAIMDKIYQERGEVECINLLVSAQGDGRTMTQVSVGYYRALGLLPGGDCSLSSIDWLKIDRNLITNFYLTPERIDCMTLTEIFTLYSKEEEVPFSQREAQIKAYKSLNAHQRLELAKLHSRFT